MELSQNIIRAIPLACIGLLVYLSLIPHYLEIRTGLPREIEHVIAYFLTAAALALLYPRKRLYILVGLGILSGCLELLQLFSPGRLSSLLDVGASWTGAALGIAAIALLCPLAKTARAITKTIDEG